MGYYQEIKELIQLHNEEGDFCNLSDEEVRLKAYKFTFDLIMVPNPASGYIPMSLLACGKYTDQALLEILNIQPIRGMMKSG